MDLRVLQAVIKFGLLNYLPLQYFISSRLIQTKSKTHKDLTKCTPYDKSDVIHLSRNQCTNVFQFLSLPGHSCNKFQFKILTHITCIPAPNLPLK